MELELVQHFKYQRLIINVNCSFNLAITGLTKQAFRAIYTLIGKCTKLGLLIDLQIQLFGWMRVPIMLYGCEVWGSENYTETEKLNLKCLKNVLEVHGWTTNNMA